jgi:hypothetical protein
LIPFTFSCFSGSLLHFLDVSPKERGRVSLPVTEFQDKIERAKRKTSSTTSTEAGEREGERRREQNIEQKSI